MDNTCRACGQQFPHVYRNGFICFDIKFLRFFKLRDHGHQDAGTVNLEYTEEFLNTETPGLEDYSKPSTDLNPPIVSLPVVDGKVDLDFVSRKAWKGSCCAVCGWLNSQNSWEVFTAKVTRIFTPIDLADDHRHLYTGYAIIEDEFAPEISANDQPRSMESMAVDCYGGYSCGCCKEGRCRG
ncbi:hypothetical protein FPQ18DRAFT_66514 [Pyronema domesticum]|nr:hypothetical protein FPQ18DRAFT_66514 [Pyronema domesticum]